MKLNYPIKYAAMPVKYPSEYYDFSFFGIDDPYLDLYIVSKCYQISKKEINSQNGINKMKYEVVFPYRQINKKFHFERREPEYAISRCKNSIILENAFDCYEDALKEANKMNQKKLIESFEKVGYDPEKEDRIKRLRDDILRKYKEYEFMITENTSDLIVENEIKEQSFIQINKRNNKASICDISIYEYFFLKDDIKYVYHVSKEEYQMMKEQIENMGTLDSKYFNPVAWNLPNCLAIYKPEIGIMSFFNYSQPLEKGGFCRKESSLTGEYMEYDEDLLPSPTESDFDLLDSSKIIYTMESYKDMLQAYLPVYYRRPGIIVDGNPMQYSLPWEYDSLDIITEEKPKQKRIGKIS